jgi:hypothetical protein
MSKYGIDFENGNIDYRKKCLNVDAMDFSALGHISAGSDYLPGSNLFDGVNETTERKRKRK